MKEKPGGDGERGTVTGIQFLLNILESYNLGKGHQVPVTAAAGTSCEPKAPSTRDTWCPVRVSGGR